MIFGEPLLPQWVISILTTIGFVTVCAGAFISYWLIQDAWKDFKQHRRDREITRLREERDALRRENHELKVEWLDAPHKEITP